MTHKPPQGIDAPNRSHKLKKQMVGEFVYYICECGQKFRIEPWDGKVTGREPGADAGTTPPPSTAEFEPLLRGELKHGRSCPAVGAPMDEGNCDCGLKWRIRLQTEMTLRNAWEKRAYEAEAALAAAERGTTPPEGLESALRGVMPFMRYQSVFDYDAYQAAIAEVSRVLAATQRAPVEQGRERMEYDLLWMNCISAAAQATFPKGMHPADELKLRVEAIASSMKPCKLTAPDHAREGALRRLVIPETGAPPDHLAHVQRFLTEMYQVMVGPVEEFTGNIEQLCALLIDRAKQDRETIHGQQVNAALDGLGDGKEGGE